MALTLLTRSVSEGDDMRRFSLLPSLTLRVTDPLLPHWVDGIRLTASVLSETSTLWPVTIGRVGIAT